MLIRGFRKVIFTQFKMPLKFRCGTNILVYGVSGSGKSHFVMDIIKHRLITSFPDKVYYFYKVRQPFMDTWVKSKMSPKISFIEDLPTNELENGNCLAIFDDLLLNNLKTVAELFVYGSHHLNVTVMFLSQNLYPKDEFFRLMSLNSHYMVLFADIRSQRQVNTLANQIFTSEDKMRLVNAFRMAINTPYGFVVLNFVKDVPREITVLTNFWSDTPSVFL